MTLLQAIVLAIIEGLTEFLPVSSTGHMIIGSTIMGIAQDDLTKLFTVAIQLGAILSVVVLYWRRFVQGLDLYGKLAVAVVPAFVLGFLLGDAIDAMLENVLVVGVMLLLGGVVFLFIDRWAPGGSGRPLTTRRAFIIGLWQCLALVPGVSRSAATIIGGMAGGLSRTQAAEFSFLLAVPTMLGATGKKLLDHWGNGATLEAGHLTLLVVGNAVAFLVAIIAIRSFVAFLTDHGFKAFGWYRIVVGGAIVLMWALGVPLRWV
jgi:undecaprenyl-diphosphatase